MRGVKDSPRKDYGTMKVTDFNHGTDYEIVPSFICGLNGIRDAASLTFGTSLVKDR